MGLALRIIHLSYFLEQPFCGRWVDYMIIQRRKSFNHKILLIMKDKTVR